MKANIRRITYIPDAYNKFHVITEFSKLPVESFDTLDQAEDFIMGYKTGLTSNSTMKQGAMFRIFVNMDISAGEAYQCVNEYYLNVHRLKGVMAH